ncbi:MAG: chromosome segregation protein SMC [Acidobacteria bacterium]|nr:chromosome segregation protein SMC [Acidobacteriota bacterium]
MHRVESLEISGFKSFRNKVKVSFSGGISAIVGPNGCGKSNICDAFLWVMGEQSAKVLRGSRMDDVIFNGTQRYGPVSLADVTLRLKHIPGDEPEEECLSREDIEICRRLYRDGAGEYFLNGRRCRLMDIQETFEGTGLGYTSYAIIEQGRIQDIISSKPLEKRALIEEAARVISFKHRKKSALVKLESAGRNLLRIRDIIFEIERNLKSLRVQVQKARRYRYVRDRMRVFLKARFVQLRDRYTAALQELAGGIAAVEANLARSAHALQERGEAINRRKVELFAQEKDLRRVQDDVNDAQFEIQRITLSNSHLNNQLEDLARRSQTIARELEEIADRRASREERLGEVKRLSADLQARQADAEGRLKVMEERHALKSRELEVRERELETLRARVFEDAGQMSNLRNTETKFLEQERWVEKERVRLEGTLEGHRAAVRQLDGELSGLEDTLGTLQAKLEELENDKGLQEEELSILNARCSDLEARRNEGEQEAAAVRIRLRAIEELEARNELYSDTVKKFLPRIAGHPSYLGTVADHLEAGENFDPVMEGFLREDLETLVVNTPELLKQGIDFVRDNKGGVFRFVLGENGFTATPRGTPASVPPAAAVKGRLLDALQPDSRGETLLRRVFPDIDEVWLVPDLDTALETVKSCPGITCLSLDGAAVTGAGRVTVFGALSGKGVLGFRREKKELQQKLFQAEKHLDGLRAETEALGGRIDALEEQLAEREDELHEYGISRMKVQEEIRRKAEEHRRQANLARTGEAELGAVLADQGRIREELRRVREGILAMEAAGAAGREEYERSGAEIVRLREELAVFSRELADARAEHGTARERMASAISEQRQLVQTLEELAARQGKLGEERTGIEDRLGKAREELTANTEGHRALVARREELGKQEEAAAREVGALRTALEKEESGLEGFRKELDTHREAKNRLEMERVRLTTDLGHLADDVANEFHVDLSNLCPDNDPDIGGLDVEALQERYQRYRDQAEKMGSVNLAAMEEFEREEERLTFHRAQETDITESIESTRKAIEEIDRRSVRLFRETFDRINVNFQEMFTALFGGGVAHMRLVDEENVLESGVDIVASPPGKKLQNILLLSGGEKALTALALMLALFKYRPSPFCILDEVDAPLDESNIDRFVSLVREMSTHTQYVIITHNKRTMEIAETIYGVTMEEAGISKVLAVQLKDVESVL